MRPLTPRRQLKIVVPAVTIFFSLAMAATAHTNNTPALGSYNNIGIEPHPGSQIPLSLKFQNESGQTVTLGSYFEKKPVILSLVYYGCRMMCTLTEYGMVNALKEVPESIGDQYLVLTVSFDPREKSDVAMLNKKTYTDLYGRPGAREGWHFLVGDASSIHALTAAVGFHYEYMADIDLFSHPTGIMVLTPQGKIANYFYGIQYRAQDIRLALADAMNEKIESPDVINARLQNGIAGGAQQNAGTTVKPQCAPGMGNHPAPTASQESKP